MFVFLSGTAIVLQTANSVTSVTARIATTIWNMRRKDNEQSNCAWSGTLRHSGLKLASPIWVPKSADITKAAIVGGQAA